MARKASVIIQETVSLSNRGFLPYRGQVDATVYEALGCAKHGQAAWFCKDGVYQCIGCSRACSQTGAEGFQRLIAPRKGVSIQYATLPAVTVDELLRSKKLFLVSEVALILSLGNRTVYEKIDAGLLTSHPDTSPVRIYRESIEKYLRTGSGHLSPAEIAAL